jgi:two-component system, OmpR family, response regulator ChvI
MTAVLEQTIETLEAPAPAFLASVSEPDAIRVLLIEEGARGSLTDELSKQGFIVRRAVSLAVTPDAARDVDVIVLHCDLAKISSIDLLGKFRGLGLDIPVVLLTDEAAPAHECLALDKGAIDVILKSRGTDVLATRLKGVVKIIRRTDRPRSGGPMECGKLLLCPDIGRACWEGVDVGLTLGEYNIVHLLVSNAGRYITYRAIYDRLHYEGFIGGSGPDGYRANVRSAIKRIRIKFGACESAFDEIENYPGFGYCWKKPA